MDWGPWLSNSYGKKVMELKGPFVDKQRRLNPDAEFENVDRKWRQQWINDQHLSHKDSSVHRLDIYRNPDYQKARFNLVRRIWQKPMTLFEENVLCRFFSRDTAYATRWTMGRVAQMYVVGVGIAYYFMYIANDWQQRTGWKVHTSRKALYPGDPEYPHGNSTKRTKPSDYNDRNFSSSPI